MAGEQDPQNPETRSTPSLDSTQNLSNPHEAPASADAAAGRVYPAEAAAAMKALPAGCALLLILEGPNVGARFLLDEDHTSVGRDPDCGIFLDDVTVSRRHAEFSKSGDTFLVRDTGSLNGTYVEREREDSRVLQNFEEVQIGKYRFVFHDSKAFEEAPSRNIFLRLPAESPEAGA